MLSGASHDADSCGPVSTRTAPGVAVVDVVDGDAPGAADVGLTTDVVSPIVTSATASRMMRRCMLRTSLFVSCVSAALDDERPRRRG
ncbi:hypothetical protein GCM10010488_39220 [Oerskovia jenensis]